MLHYFKNHMKQSHHHHTPFKHVPKDFTNKDPEKEEFIVYPKDIVATFKEPHKKRRNEYGFDDIDKVPRPHVSYQDLKCYYCMYSTKIRLNLIKHLNLHKRYPNGIPPADSLQDISKTIPAKQPTNPVPRLDRKELMFDKMMNLAGSSFEDKKKMELNELRTKHPIPLDEFSKLPGYVPEEKVNSCGIDGCRYLSLDETMLKCHIITLHSEVEYFQCPHCIDTPLTVDQIGTHFKLHGESLYRCGWCQFLTPRKALVERHLTEAHPLNAPFDFCIRGTEGGEKDTEGENKEGINPKEIEAPLNDGTPTSAAAGDVPPTIQPWFRSISRLHENKPVEGSSSGNVTSNSSNSKLESGNQELLWRCGLCTFRSVSQTEMINHTTLKHDIKSQYKCGYCKVRSSARTSFEVHFAKKHPDKKFRVLCMYYRLDSDDIEPLPPGGSTSSHEPLWKRNDPDRRKMIRGILLDDDDDDKELSFLNIQPGSPNGEEFVCPKCLSFKTPCINTFRSHLCKEANYQRFECAECGMTNPLLASLRRHYTKTHGSHFTSDCYIMLPVENTLEAWVESIISHQQHMIKLYKENDGNAISLPSPSKLANRRPSSHSEIEISGMILHESGSDKSKYTCSLCGVECRTASGLKSHKTAMHQAKYKCQYCPFSSNTELAIYNHRTLKHPKQNSSDERNKIVNVSASPESELMGQEDDKKIEKQKLSCLRCTFTTTVMKTFQQHSQIHFMYVCEYCDKRFETAVDGKRHSTRKHPNMPAKIINSPADLPQTLKNSSFDEYEDGKEKEIPKPFDPADTQGVKSRTIYSCCHCSIKGPYSFVEDHIKAHHKFLPFLVRKEEENSFTLEVYKYRCIHCKNDSDSFEEAMGHWTRSHVRLSFTFSMSLSSSTIINCDSDSSSSSNRKAETEPPNAKSESLPSSSMSKPEFSIPKSKTTITAKPDSSIPSDLDDSVESTDDDPNSSFSSETVETGTECEAEPVSSSSDQEQLVKCGYCRRQCRSKEVIEEHIKTVHKGKKIKMKYLTHRLKKALPEIENLERVTPISRSGNIQKAQIRYRCDICYHIVKVRRSIKAHMDRLHPDNNNAFSVMPFSNPSFMPPAKQPFKCNYCGDTSATIEEIRTHHAFLHSHLSESFINLRDEALASLHKSSSGCQNITPEELSPHFSASCQSSQLPDTFSQSSVLSNVKTPFIKNSARKSFPLKFLQKRQIATKSTAGRLQLIRRDELQKLSTENAADTNTCRSEPLISSNEVTIDNKKENEAEPLDLNQVYADFNLLGNSRTRLSVTQYSALVNIKPLVVVKKIYL